MASAEEQSSVGREMVTCSLGIKSVGAETRTIDVIASTDRVDSYGEVVMQDDWNLERVKGVGVPVFYNHQTRGLPIGKVAAAGLVDGRLQASLQITTEDINPEAEKVWKAVKAGLIGAVSVGFMPGTFGMEERDGKSVLKLGKSELIEISVTPTPANSDAAIMRLRSKAMLVTSNPIVDTVAPSESGKSEVKDMNQLFVELGLTDAEGAEAEALTIVKALRARVANHDSVLEELAMPGCADGEQILTVLKSYKAASEQVPALEARIKTLEADAERMQRDSLVEKILSANKATPYQRDHYLPTLSVKELRLFLETAPKIGPLTGKVEQPSPEAAKQAAGKLWKELPPKEKARLFQEDRTTYDALKAAAGE